MAKRKQHVHRFALAASRRMSHNCCKMPDWGPEVFHTAGKLGLLHSSRYAPFDLHHRAGWCRTDEFSGVTFFACAFCTKQLLQGCQYVRSGQSMLENIVQLNSIDLSFTRQLLEWL